ncbi:MAG: hypothetical protein K6A41_10710 [Bacteroidales bacterium]|nr:hypothetical protein [Bacteroidales bacterium]
MIGVLFLLLVIYYFSVNNHETALRKEAEAQDKAIASVHDTMWKVIKEKASVSEKYRETFEKVYPELISGRYKDGNNSAMKWIQEANPDFDTSLYKDLMQAIEAQRMYFQNAQKRMLDIIRERETLINSMPQKWFISNKQPIEYTVIASEHTSDVMGSRVDNETLSL